MHEPLISPICHSQLLFLHCFISCWTMANSKIIIAPVLISFFFLAAVLPYESNAKSLKSCGFDAIYQLGDSISDTGNFIQEKPSAVYARFPYGETFFNKPTGRCSNGRLMIDFIGKEIKD